MRIELIELLGAREICHPTRIELLESQSPASLRLEISGISWWLGKSEVFREGKICLQINDIIEGFLDAEVIRRDYYEEDLESFSANLLCEQNWAKGEKCEIFCSSPLADPLGLYAYVEDYLTSFSCPYPASKYFNMGGSNQFKTFREITSDKSYLLATAPELVSKIICDYLKERGCEFNVVQGKNVSGDLIYIQLGEGYFICGEAYATYE